MATIAQSGMQGAAEQSWELPQEKPLIVRIARPWLRNPVGLLGLVIVVAFVFLGLFGLLPCTAVTISVWSMR